VAKKELCQFGLIASVKLVEIGETKTWLANEVSDETGLFVDAAYLYKIFTGERNAPKVKAAIEKILGIGPDVEAAVPTETS